MMSPIKQLSACAIVRDEAVNPAGTIEDFVSHLLDLAEEVCVLDTGSVDGTYDRLQASASRSARIRLGQERFRGFARARNQSMRLASKEYLLIIDADERVTPSSSELLGRLVRAAEHPSYHVLFQSVPDGDDPKYLGLNPRVLKRDAGFHFQHHMGGYPDARRVECVARRGVMLHAGQCTQYAERSDVLIEHFCPAMADYDVKRQELYRAITKGRYPSPSRLPGFAGWKRLDCTTTSVSLVKSNDSAGGKDA
jgi:glycosyltransferase involved in cell wall biosynthesis